MSSRSIFSTPLAIAAVVAASRGDARAESWFVAEAPAAIAVSDPQSGTFRAGIMPALGAYTDNGTTALGLRMRAGVLRNGPAPTGNLSDPGVGGLVTGGVVVRFALGNGWVEGVAGGGFTGDDLVPAVEVGAGWDFATQGFDIGPSIRYLRVVSRDHMATLGSADLVLIGLDIQFGKHRAHAAPLAIAAAAPRVAPPPPPPAPEPALDRDPDRIVEHDDGCEADADGCEIAEHIFLKNDRIVLEERVLFDTDRARIKQQGRGMIADIVRVWRDHPEWQRLTIEGHADVRGTDDYNLELSRRRAESVRTVFVELGVEPGRIEAVGYGRSRPRDPGTTAAAYQLNRRVEFAIEREIPVPAVGASR